MAPFRNDLDAADARKAQLAKELEEAEEHSAALRARQEGAQQPSPKRDVFRPTSGWRKRKKLIAFPFVVLSAFVLMPAFGNCTASSCGYRAVVIDALESCPEAKAALGDDIHFGRLGMACGTTTINDDEVPYDYARWRMPISGSRSSGVYHFDARDEGKGWSVHSGLLEVDGKKLDLSACSRPQQRDTSMDAQPAKAAPPPLSPSTVLMQKCESGIARACRDLSLLFELGNSVEKDATRAQEYLHKACQLGMPSACPPAPTHTKESP